ncbi:MAG: DUF1385 domain-containing protein [Clostridia bacterium]|nr:DUF1385 domain-containing protein [Clostridia bacterium]
MSKKCKNECKKTSIGGQALIEGIMMRGPKYTAMAVRDPNGKIVLEKWRTQEKPAPKIAKLPVIRGVYGFISSMITGYKSLMRSAEISGLEEAEEELRLEKEAKKAAKLAKKQGKTETVQEAPAPDVTDKEATEPISVTEENGTADAPKTEPIASKIDKTDKKGKKKEKESSPLVTVIMLIGTVLGIVLSVGLFIMLPVLIYDWCTPIIPDSITSNMWLNTLVKSVFEGVLRIIVLVAYMLLVSLMKDIRRTFRYHGAEHKTIFCYEHGNKLTVENVRKEGRFHPRCGTSFLILMLIVGIFVSFFIDPAFLLITKDPAIFDTAKYTVMRTGIKILLTPLIMGLGYELIKFAGRHDNIITKIISAPGVWLQHITVLEPDDGMIECAIRAFVEVMPAEEREMYVEKTVQEDSAEYSEEARLDIGDTDAEDSPEETCKEDVSEARTREVTEEETGE